MRFTRLVTWYQSPDSNYSSSTYIFTSRLSALTEGISTVGTVMSLPQHERLERPNQEWLFLVSLKWFYFNLITSKIKFQVSYIVLTELTSGKWLTFSSELVRWCPHVTGPSEPILNTLNRSAQCNVIPVRNCSLFLKLLVRLCLWTICKCVK